MDVRTGWPPPCRRRVELEIESLGLRGAAIEEIGGLAFVHLGADPEPFGAPCAELAAALEPQGLAAARVAHEIEYAVAANWKLVWETNRECWHCHDHPEYIRANFDAVPDSEHWRRLAAARAAEHDAALTASGLRVDHDTPGLYPFPTAGHWWSANRTPLVGGYVTESLDGQPVAPLMGSYASRDSGRSACEQFRTHGCTRAPTTPSSRASHPRARS